MSFESFNSNSPELSAAEREPTARVQHIREDSEVYRAQRKEARQNSSGLLAFGEYELKSLQADRVNLARMKENPGESDAVDFQNFLHKEIEEGEKRVHRLRDLLKDKMRRESTFGAFFQFFEDATTSARVRLQAEALGILNVDTEDPQLELEKKFVADEIPDPLFEDMVAAHIDRFNQQQKEFAESELPQMKIRLRKAVAEAVERADLPAVAIERFNQRMNEATIELTDIVLLSFAGHRGDHSLYNGRITIASHLSRQERFKTFAHEFMHGLSGKTLLQRSQTQTIEHQRNGLGFGGEGQMKKKFEWLNEAVTETIAIGLANQQESRSYVKERQVLEILIKKGVPREMIYEAYFENFDPDRSEKIPAWKAFSKKLEELFPEVGVRLLSNIERDIFGQT